MEPMAADANPSPETSDEQRLFDYGRELADGVEAALPGWVEANVERIAIAYRGEADDKTMTAARSAGEEAQQVVVPKLRSLLALDVDEQRGNPLAIVRDAVR